MKTKYKIYLFLLIFSLVPLGLFGTFLIQEHVTKIHKIMEEELTMVSNGKISAIEDFGHARKQELQGIARYGLVKKAVMASLGRASVTREEEAYVENILEEQTKLRGSLTKLAVLNQKFQIVAVGGKDRPIGTEDGMQTEDQKVMNQTFEYQTLETPEDFCITNMYERTVDGTAKKMVAAIAGIFQDEERIGYVVEEIPTVYFNRIQEEVSAWGDGCVNLVDGNRQCLAESCQGQPEEEIREKKKEALDKVWQEAVSGTQEQGIVNFRVSGREYLVCYSTVADTEWSLWLTVNLSDYQKQKSLYFALFFVMLFCAIALFLIGALVFYRWVTRPVNTIVRVLEQIQREDNYSLRVGITDRTEIGFLSQHLDALLNYIEQERYQVRQAQRDPLTGLKNRTAILKELQNQVLHAQQENKRILLGIVEVEEYRNICQRYGPGEGSRCIRFAASILEEKLNASIGRTGENTFLFCSMKPEAIKAVGCQAAEAVEQMKTGYVNFLGTQKIPVSCHIGMVSQNGTRFDSSSLQYWGQEALQRAKAQSDGIYVLEGIGDVIPGEEIDFRYLLEQQRQCITQGCQGFYLRYQPLVDADTGRIVGAEALLRWRHPEFGELSPDTFIALLEEDSSYYELGSWILEKAVEETRTIAAKDPAFMLHVNVVYSQMVRGEFREEVMELLKKHDFPPQNLCLELTERCQALNLEYLREVMEFFRKRGVATALDDFGTGFSSLSYLRELPVDRLKIDRSFISNISSSQADQAIVRSVIQCAASMRIKVCAEGVENRKIVDYLKRYPGLIYQGYYYSSPVGIEKFIELTERMEKESWQENT